MFAITEVAGTADYNMHRVIDKAEARDPMGSDGSEADVLRMI